jgi:hypothetical protein
MKSKTEELKELKDSVKEDIAQYAEIEAVASMKGGKRIIKNLKADIIGSIDKLSSKYQTVSHTELISYCAELKERLSLYKLFMVAPNNAKMAKEALNKLLEEYPDVE